ncbi:hypothetical protein A2U01_0085425, partial [Trifolium medium]|nr:hypothetical protein [Trifolium medium]
PTLLRFSGCEVYKYVKTTSPFEIAFGDEIRADPEAGQAGPLPRASIF